MTSLRALFDHYEAENTPLKKLSLEESKALFDLLLLAVMIDGVITQDELEKLSEESEKFPFADPDHFEEIIGRHALATRNSLETLVEDEEAIDEFIRQRASIITDEEKRRESLKMIAVVAYSDGVDPSEEALCHQIGAHFGFSEDEIENKLLVGALDSLG